ncbi:MAG TPA: gamma-glutamyltransferase [Chitinophagaceae bacterium]|nr:gamma-glutamyltransferase [Chitinophagaceae bacterium]
MCHKVFYLFSLIISTAVAVNAQQAVTAAPGIDAFHYSIQKKVVCSNGAVVSAHPLASKAGVLILKKGGNAVDAAIATQLALAVVYPGAGNIGGGGFMVARLQNGKNITLDYRETAPAAAQRDMYLDKNGNPQMNLSQYGHLASGVPGTIAGVFASLPYARLPFKTLIAPAIELADKGFAITENEAASLNGAREAFIKYNTVQPVFVKSTPWKAGDILVQKDLANTLKRIRDLGQKGFYEGETARLIVAEMNRGKGLVTLDDLKKYQAKERTPMLIPYKGYTIVTMPLPSSGGIIIAQALKIIEGRDIAHMGFHSVASVHLMVEAERRAYADRAQFMGDADFVKVPVKKLTSDAYIKDRMSDFDPTKAGSSQATPAGTINPESEETTHLSIPDKNGNAVSITTTLNGGYGSKTVVGGAGFLLNNEMDDFSVKPGVPNMYGAVGAEANAIAPGKRMLSSMTPAIVLKNNKPYIVLGTPGGTTIPTSVFQTLVNMLEFGMAPTEAINQPKFHHQWQPDEVAVEKDFPAAVVSGLKAMGYKIAVRNGIGRTEVIKIVYNASGKATIDAAGDKRGDDSVEGF